MYCLVVTLRYFRKKRATFFAVAGIALGVTTLVTVTGVVGLTRICGLPSCPG
jgi:ABC-type lipoprotein release transport system permease subunit